VTRDTLEIVEDYDSEHQASLAKAKLEAYGVSSRLLSSRKTGRYGAELPARTIVAVSPEDVEAAREILLGDHGGALSATLEGRLPPGADELCRFCGAEALERVRDDGTIEAFRWMFRLRRHYRCRSCARDQ
jgi:hypothetical protein